MSEMSEPRRKRQKCDGEETTPDPMSSIVLGGPMYDEAAARKILKDVPEVFDEDGVEGFNPDDAALDDIYNDECEFRDVTPMLFFVERGDLKMCRYLISRGASTTKAVRDDHTPMQAASKTGHLDVFKLLYFNGAKHHLRAEGTWETPFHRAANKGYDDFVRWLVLHGALCSDDNSEEIAGDLIYNRIFLFFNNNIRSSCRRLVDWSKDVLQTHSSVITFLLGTLPRTPNQDRECILQCFGGHPGIRKNIGDFVGLEVTKAKQLRILRSVVEVLPETMRVGWIGRK